MKNNKYEEKLIDWVMTFSDYYSPTDAQFSATQVAHLIMRFNQDKLSGKIKF